MITCYNCTGAKVIRDKFSKNKEYIKCPTCKGTGVVSTDKALAFYDRTDEKRRSKENA